MTSILDNNLFVGLLCVVVCVGTFFTLKIAMIKTGVDKPKETKT